ncbi:MAG: hypothetical protein ACREQC_09705 [Candidatus Binataceae bacterium]
MEFRRTFVFSPASVTVGMVLIETKKPQAMLPAAAHWRLSQGQSAALAALLWDVECELSDLEDAEVELSADFADLVALSLPVPSDDVEPLLLEPLAVAVAPLPAAAESPAVESGLDLAA